MEQVSVVDPRKHLNLEAPTKIDIRHLNFYYGTKQALTDVSLPIRERQVTALIGPSGCGKTTFLRTLNCMNDLIPGTRTEGEAIFEGENIYDKSEDVVLLRQRIGMVFQRANPFPKSIFENIAHGLHIQGKSQRQIKETGFFLSHETVKGQLIEYGPTVDIFERPKKKETEDYISGRFG